MIIKNAYTRYLDNNYNDGDSDDDDNGGGIIIKRKMRARNQRLRNCAFPFRVIIIIWTLVYFRWHSSVCPPIESSEIAVFLLIFRRCFFSSNHQPPASPRQPSSHPTVSLLRCVLFLRNATLYLYGMLFIKLCGTQKYSTSKLSEEEEKRVSTTKGSFMALVTICFVAFSSLVL